MGRLNQAQGRCISTAHFPFTFHAPRFTLHPMNTFPAFVPPPRLLMGPGPSEVAPSVLKAMSQPLLGHLDPVFVKMMDEIKAMLRQVFLTKNDMTFPISGTGSAGMEFCCVNLIEPGDEVIIGVNGVFGTRMCEVAERCGAQVTKVEAPWGRIIEPRQVAEALRGHRPKFVAKGATAPRKPGGRPKKI